ncbi:EthD domain-containing protein [Rhizobium multihospitium]|uniref:EthD domain-containing protein n=1 Tax=Rhizobium multihospitium TaxID=410764 RepID=A0A1C3X5D9_9HYPH|nr:EthD domain-containing protein [Rhizobium multihospitium]SCB47437.1 conserved hypothetical protein [Rhizobium multihospitium]
MLKRMTLLAKREDLSIEAFRTHWAGNHAQLALSLPGVCKYSQNRIDEELLTIPQGGAFNAQGIVELYFTDAETMKTAQASDTGNVMIPDDELLFLKGWSLNIVEVDGPNDGVGAKVMIPLAARETLTTEQVVDALTDAARAAGATAISLNHVTTSHARPRLWSEPVAPTMIFVAWFESSNHARGAFNPGSSLHDAVRGVSRLASVYLCDPLTIL